jgi:hypothetical protein
MERSAVTTSFIRRCTILLVPLALGLSTDIVSGRPAKGGVAEEEYAVYDVVIERLYVQRRSASLIVIAKETESGPQPEPGKGPIIGVADPEEMKGALKLIADLTPAYEARNEEPAKLKELFKLSADYVLVSKKKGSGLLAKDQGKTKHFSKAYPGSESVGLVGLSRVGFNADHTQALLYAVHWCGSGCGDGMFVLLRKENDQWSIRYETIASVAGTGT